VPREKVKGQGVDRFRDLVEQYKYPLLIVAFLALWTGYHLVKRAANPANSDAATATSGGDQQQQQLKQELAHAQELAAHAPPPPDPLDEVKQLIEGYQKKASEAPDAPDAPAALMAAKKGKRK